MTNENCECGHEKRRHIELVGCDWIDLTEQRICHCIAYRPTTKSVEEARGGTRPSPKENAATAWLSRKVTTDPIEAFLDGYDSGYAEGWNERDGKTPTYDQLTTRTRRLEAALREIEKGEGRYSRDPLTHAANTIEDMKAIATAALASADEALSRP